MKTIERLFLSICVALPLAWIIMVMRWLHTDKGIVRLREDWHYLVLAMAGIVWLVGVLWFAIEPKK